MEREPTLGDRVRRLSARLGRRQGEKDIYVEGTLAGDLEGLGVRFEPSRYPGLVRLIVEEPEHELIGRLAPDRDRFRFDPV